MSQAGRRCEDAEKAKELHYLWARKGLTGRLFLESCLNRLDDQGSEGYPPGQVKLEGMDFSERFSMCSAEHLVLLPHKPPENKTCSFTENPSPLPSHKADRSHQECFPWFGDWN